MGIHPMDGALVGAGSLWPPPFSTCKPSSAFENKRAFCTLHLERPDRRHPLIFWFYSFKIIVVIVSCSSIPVLVPCQLLGLTIRLVWALCHQWFLFLTNFIIYLKWQIIHMLKIWRSSL
jgi:hypothetical protein